MLKSAHVAILALAVALGAARVASAEELNSRGRPDGVAGNQTQRYYVWHDAEGYHIRFTTAQHKHRFSGEIRVTTGAILRPSGVRDGVGDKNETWWELSDKAQTLKFDLTTRTTLDGLDFKLGGKVEVAELTLKIDGEELPSRVFVGSKSVSPKSATFTIPH